ncbi:acetyl- carboxylase [Lasius niger]|uniref:Biotin carboxyl carrier protein of acetyl-CoA carboxylase n=1 Tax=Lasius niger TaxID=67767 RepID=A0A0J7KV96_LASNI|nr:acetyl- carboxylase [Lasius niger]
MGGMKVDKNAIRDLADMLHETGLSEIEIAKGDHHIRVARQLAVSSAQVVAAPVAVSAPQAAPEVAPVQDDSSHPGAVKSPIVGVAYLTPDPASPPYFKAGDKVQAGDTLLLIEAMKTFNQIKASKSGTLVKYCVESGEPVEFGEPLAIIE